MSKPHLSHLKSASDLRTTREATRAGFVALALEKNRRASPHVARARALHAAALAAKTPMDLLKIPDIQLGILSAAGVSHKAATHLTKMDKDTIALSLIENFLMPAGDKFVEELTYRYLLISGDSLGGSMRNVAGALAGQKLARALLACLKLKGQDCRWLARKSWQDVPEDDAGIESLLNGLSWQTNGRERTLCFNIKVPIVRNNIDLVLLDCCMESHGKVAIKTPAHYIALGELKGGIDPAGADEHWKTARSALERIRSAFSQSDLSPHTFFIGAAIEDRMANEIWEMLEIGTIENAANMTDENQLAAVARWICSL